jgi:hypothetical protein
MDFQGNFSDCWLLNAFAGREQGLQMGYDLYIQQVIRQKQIKDLRSVSRSAQGFQSVAGE